MWTHKEKQKNTVDLDELSTLSKYVRLHAEHD